MGEIMKRHYLLEDLADELDLVFRAIKSGQPTLWEAKQLAAHFREAFITPDLFPNETEHAKHVAAQLSVIQELELALDRMHGLGISAKTRLRDIPCVDTALRHSLDEAAANRPGGISFR
ncbi:hypothetical protein DK842_21310 [Chromobacterium phragmitis]|uniref:hypothetical protein n=1 Tax=Chromobacterium phragmitis TaxID=2202141 RepID=UPI000DEC2912|nr:hypothetical protein [Chromobacterium phragmitis]AXE32220.1 hypothetical protein DK842_21310 [Chromobacterium phragmitis]